MDCLRTNTRWLAALAALAGMAVSAPALAADIAVRQIGPNQFEFRLTHPTSLAEPESQALIAGPAAQVCNGLRPVPGKYRFEARQPIGGAASADQGGFVFYQEVSCEAGPAPEAGERRPTLDSPAEALEVESEVKRLTEAHFGLVLDGKLEEAYAQKATAAEGSDRTEWISGARDFRDTAGKPVRLEVVKVTVYDNPAEAPEPGLYAAADFVNAFANLPFHCGYLMWFRPTGGEFRITREEAGAITAEQVRSLSPDQLAEAKRQMRCTPP